jgi:hypothetical protein
LGNFIDCVRGKSKEHKSEGIFLGRSFVAMEKKSLRLSGAKRLRLQSNL